jgi:hypothetical protein
MSSAIDIANQALTTLGADRIISFSDGTTEADVMATIYEPQKKAFLRAYPWNFAIKRAKLAQLADAPVNEYQYQYALPDDFIKLLNLYKGDYQTVREHDEQSEYQIEGRRILSNSTNLYLKYVYDVVESQFEAAAEMAFVAKLAAEASYPLQGSPGNQQTLLQIAELKMVEARTSDNLEAGTEIFRTTRLDQVRY